jgi:hypothetical protein
VRTEFNPSRKIIIKNNAPEEIFGKRRNFEDITICDTLEILLGSI